MLLYARTDEALISDCGCRISGSRISVKTLDLNQDFSKIREKLDQITRLISS